MPAETSNFTSPGSDQPVSKTTTEGSPGPSPLLEPYLNQHVSTKKSASKTADPSKPAPAADGKPSAKPQGPANQWTVVADLGILFDSVGKNGNMGGQDKLHNLDLIVKDTKGKPVTIIADVLVNDDASVNRDDLSKSKKPYQVERVIIHDGELKVISTTPSQGTQKDLANLLDYSLKNAPSEKVVLAINEHGLGNQGIQGGMIGRDNGLVPIEIVSSTIASTLKANGRDKLDLVDLDSCLMAQQGVLQQLAPVTKDLVASEDTERVSTAPFDIDGQNLGKWIDDLLQNPSMSGDQLGKKIVAEANQNANGLSYGLSGSEDIQGTKTLTNFDLSHLPEFNDKLNTLGFELTKALANPRNRMIIESQISQQHNITNGSEIHPDMGAYAAKVDLLGLVNQLRMWTSDGDSGGIADPDHKLKAALTDMQTYLQDRNKLMDATHLPAHEDTARKPLILAHDNFGGVSVYIPSGMGNNPTPEQVKARKHSNDIESGGNAGWNGFLNAVD